MLDFFKEGQPQDVKAIRNKLLQFIKEQLQKTEGGEGNNIKRLQLYIACTEQDKHLYEAAVFAEEENKFKEEEVQRIADDYAIDLPQGWAMEILFTDKIPPEAIKAPLIDAGLFISTKQKQVRHKHATAYLRILSGVAEQEIYTLTSDNKKVNIGREKRAQTPEGYIRENQIAFPTEGGNENNRSISRQHAHIQWNNETGAYYLFADEGGLPPLNKTKLRTADGQSIKLQSSEIGHRLQEGDQILIGESTLLEFTYKEPKLS